MPGDLAVTPVHALPPASPAGAAVPPATSTPPPAFAHSPSLSGHPSESASAGTGASPSLHANPVSRLDPALGIVVLDFFNAQGSEVASIPTQKQLDSYRLHGSPGSSPAPVSTDTGDAQRTPASASLSDSAD